MARRATQKMPNATGPTGLALKWRSDAQVLRQRGGESLAVSLESCAAELEVWAKEWALERLTLSQAAEESGFGYSTLQHLVAEKRLRNVGSKHAPRIRRGDLPRKAATAAGGPDLADRVLAAHQRRRDS